MRWNWELAEWPAFAWDPARLKQAEQVFLLGGGVFGGIVRHLTILEQDRLKIEAICVEALTTSAIEGEILDRASVQSSLRKQFGLAPQGKKRAKPSEEGIAEMMFAVYRSHARPLTAEALFAWHQMVMKGRTDLPAGKYRATAEPMQIISRALYAPKVHYVAPPSARVPAEMARFLKWFNITAPSGRDTLPALTRAGIAHLYFESIHPFEDGNGRLGRAIAEKALAQALGQPTLTALSGTLLVHRKAYYKELAAASKSLDLTRWLAWFAGIAIEAQRRAEARAEFLIDKTRLLERLRGQLNARQEKALLSVLREGPEGFDGGLSAGNYASITGASPATTTRDLTDLVEKGALLRTGELRHARYFAAIPQRPVESVTIDARGHLRV